MKHRNKKSLGQNFLKSQSALRKIIEAGEVSDQDTILEIGPGLGVLTEKLLEKAGKVIAVEKDESLVEFLQEKFSEEIKNKKLILIPGDILALEDPKDISGDYKIIANIPYNITGAILKKFLTAKHQPKLMVLLVQLEVAQRIVARDKKESILSISVKAYGQPKIVDKVPARYFSPAPKVDSAIIVIGNISRDFFLKNKVKEEKFWQIVKMGFAHKRKKLGSNLRKIVSETSLAPFKDSRAENLTIIDWKELSS